MAALLRVSGPSTLDLSDKHKPAEIQVLLPANSWLTNSPWGMKLEFASWHSTRVCPESHGHTVGSAFPLPFFLGALGVEG